MFVPNFCLLATVEHNDEDIGPVTLELWPEVHLVTQKSPIALCRVMYIITGSLPIGDLEKSKSV